MGRIWVGTRHVVSLRRQYRCERRDITCDVPTTPTLPLWPWHNIYVPTTR